MMEEMSYMLGRRDRQTERGGRKEQARAATASSVFPLRPVRPRFGVHNKTRSNGTGQSSSKKSKGASMYDVHSRWQGPIPKSRQ